MTPFLVLLGGGVLVFIWLLFIVRWRWAFMALLIFLPFSGMIALRFHDTKAVLLFKDVLFVIPAYVSFLFFHRRDHRRASVPNPVLWAMGALTLLVVIQMANPQLPNLVVALIGFKVWLFYLPLVFVASAYVDSREDLVLLLRVVVVIALIPCSIGILQFLGTTTIGVQATMSSMYDDEAARAATMNYSVNLYGGSLYRLPSTFTFVSQYFGYTMGMVVFAYCLMRADPSQGWRRFAVFMVGFCIVASVLSGARGAFVFIPLMLILISLLDQRLTGIIAVAVALPVLILAALYFGGLKLSLLFGDTSNLVSNYSRDVVYQFIIDAFLDHPWGIGTGMNTGAARHALSAGEMPPILLENYYAKAMVELGFIGFPITLAVFGSIIFMGFRIFRGLKDKQLRGVAAALLGFFITIAIHSGKGWQVDYDPINVYFWVFAGMLFKLHALDATPALVQKEKKPRKARARMANAPIGRRF